MNEKRSLQCYAYAGTDRIVLKGLAAKSFPDFETKLLSAGTLLVEVSEDAFIFVFRIGGVVFVNVDEDMRLSVLEQLEIVADADELSASDEIEDDTFLVHIDPGSAVSVDFDSATIPELDTAYLRIIAHVLAQSNSLSIVEGDVNILVAESEKMLRPLQSRTWIQSGRKELLSFLGRGLDQRHKLARHLLMLQGLDITWDDEDYHLLHAEMVDCFDLNERVTTVENTLSTASESAVLLVETLNTRRGEFLEIIIILLILLEVVKSFSDF